MFITIENPKENPMNLMRKVGYFFQGNAQDEMSFIRPLARAGYPRFHAYVKMEGAKFVIKLHLDQKRETYGQSTRHHGEYEDDGALKTEGDMIKQTLA